MTSTNDTPTPTPLPPHKTKRVGPNPTGFSAIGLFRPGGLIEGFDDPLTPDEQYILMRKAAE